jgi:hypothetical protein
MRDILVSKGERTRILHLWSSSLFGWIRFTAKTSSGKPPTGKVETSIRSFLTSYEIKYPLATEHKFRKRMATTNYQIYVTPDEDTTITFQTRHFQAHQLFWVFGLVVVLGVLSALVPLIIRSL